jgi:hypothetical protein
VILKDGFLNGREKGIRKKERKEQERLKDWLLLEKNKQKMYLQLEQVLAAKR